MVYTALTCNSKYEIDFSSRRIRRVQGVTDPTLNLLADGVWHEFASLAIYRGSLLIEWPTGAKRTTHTLTSWLIHLLDPNGQSTQEIPPHGCEQTAA